MSASVPELGEPRWHADPEGGAGLRWWDGTQWTAAVMGPAELGPPVQQPLPPETPVFTASIWVIAVLPLLSTLGTLLFPSAAMTPISDPASSAQFEQSFAPSDSIQTLVSLLIYAITITLAFADRRRLLRAGYVRPFHWAWAFLSTGVYVIGRSVIVQRRIGRGLAPIWVWLAVYLVGVMVSLGGIARAFRVFLEPLGLG